VLYVTRATEIYLFRSLLLAATLSGVMPLLADDKPADRYNVSGSVLAAISKRGHFYQVATDSRIYFLMCTRARPFGFGMLDCKIGDKPIAAGDTVHFRVDGDWAYMPSMGQEAEEKLRILTTELKTIPPVPLLLPSEILLPEILPRERQGLEGNARTGHCHWHRDACERSKGRWLVHHSRLRSRVFDS